MINVGWRGPEADFIPGAARRRDRYDPLVPMINIIFLLLTFFLITGTSRISDAPKADQPDRAVQQEAKTVALTLDVGKNGGLYFAGRLIQPREAAVRIRDNLAPGGVLQVKADRNVPASTILPLLRQIQESGIASIRLIAVRPNAAAQ